MWIGLVFLLILTLLTVVRGLWPLAVIAWALVGSGALIGGDGGPFVVILGTVLFLLGGASMTRGAIFDGSPKAELSERNPSIFKGENYDLDADMDSVHFTHRFWGP